MPNEIPQNTTGERLDSWKSIASFFGRDERTVKRWEKERGLPVHRVPGGGRGTVYAYSAELSAWLHSAPEDPSTARAGSGSLGSAAGGLAVGEPGDNGNAGLRETGEKAVDSGFSQGVATHPSTHLSTHASTQASTLRRWGVPAGLLCLILAGLYGLSRFVQIRGVQGHALPRFSLRRDNEARRDAEDLYMQGRYHWSRRTGPDLTQALDDFNAAIEKDPTYAPAYAGKADAYNLLREYTSMPASQAFPLALEAARKAVSLDDSLCEAHRALGFALMNGNWDMDGAEREYRRAIALNPNDAVAHHWYATALMAYPRFPEALGEIEEARRLDPTSRSITADRAQILYASGNDREAIAILVELEKTDPEFRSPHAYLEGIYEDHHQWTAAFDEAEALARNSQNAVALAKISTGRRLLSEGGESAMLEGRLEDALKEFGQGRADALSVADAYARLGRKKETLEYLDKAYQRHEFNLIYLRNFRVMNFLRDDPAYQALLQKMGLNSFGAA